MGNAVIVAILILVIAAAVYGTVRRIRYGSSCCGEHDAADKKVRVKDKNKNNYPYVYMLGVDGMHCSNCARRIENAFNKTAGRWAVADVGKKEVLLRSKNSEEESDLAGVIASAGYTMLSCKKIIVQ